MNALGGALVVAGLLALIVGLLWATATPEGDASVAGGTLLVLLGLPLLIVGALVLMATKWRR